VSGFVDMTIAHVGQCVERANGFELQLALAGVELCNFNQIAHDFIELLRFLSCFVHQFRLQGL
jgi:hypothetical protein